MLVGIGAAATSLGCGSSFTPGGNGEGESCQGEGLQCLDDGTALQCVDGAWAALGSCPLGCDEQSRSCHAPSNVEASLLGMGTGDVGAGASLDPLVFDTDTGEIRAAGGQLRPPGPGLDEPSGIAFSIQEQGGAGPDLGVFALTGLQVAAGVTARGVGHNGLVLLVDGDATIDGTFEVVADGQAPGPGGMAGGNPTAPGGGPGGGGAGEGVVVSTTTYCVSGGGGGGFFGLGGSGGLCSCDAPNDFSPGGGGSACGTELLVPLIGGSGGAGGTLAAGVDTLSEPGPGGGGGGALQISATGSVTIGTHGVINAAGGGGGGARNASGAGGGAGGAILLEAPTVTVAVGAVLAANGGGGGAGDCA